MCCSSQFDNHNIANCTTGSTSSYRVRRDSILDEAGELFLVSLLILLHQVRHVVGHVHAHDVFAVCLRVELFALGIVSGEPLQTGNRSQ